MSYIETKLTCNCGGLPLPHCDLCASCLVTELLVQEHGVEREEAKKLVKTETKVMVNGIMSGNLRATAMALMMVSEGS